MKTQYPPVEWQQKKRRTWCMLPHCELYLFYLFYFISFLCSPLLQPPLPHWGGRFDGCWRQTIIVNSLRWGEKTVFQPMSVHLAPSDMSGKHPMSSNAFWWFFFFLGRGLFGCHTSAIQSICICVCVPARMCVCVLVHRAEVSNSLLQCCHRASISVHYLSACRPIRRTA